MSGERRSVPDYRDEAATPNGLPIKPFFDPAPSSTFASEVLRSARAEGALIGRIAMYAWIPNPDKQESTKELDIAVSRASLRKIRDVLAARGVRPRELPIGGIKVHDPDARINVDFIERSQQGDLTWLYEETVATAIARGLTANVEGGAELTLAPVEYIVAMKLGAGERKDERDAERLLRNVRMDMETVRRLVKGLGVGWETRLEAILRDLNHPAARAGYSES